MTKGARIAALVALLALLGGGVYFTLKSGVRPVKAGHCRIHGYAVAALGCLGRRSSLSGRSRSG